jgi:hypothetical protein
MSDKYISAVKEDEVAPGGMKAVELDGKEVIICNYDGKYFAIQRRCGHMNAPLNMGTLDGKYLTCPIIVPSSISLMEKRFPALFLRILVKRFPHQCWVNISKTSVC